MPQFPDIEIPRERVIGRTLSDLIGAGERITSPLTPYAQGYGPEFVNLSDLTDIPQSKAGVGLTLASMIPGGKVLKFARRIGPQTEAAAAKLSGAAASRSGVTQMPPRTPQQAISKMEKELAQTQQEYDKVEKQYYSLADQIQEQGGYGKAGVAVEELYDRAQRYLDELRDRIVDLESSMQVIWEKL